MLYVLMEYTDKKNFTAGSKARDDAASIIKNYSAKFIPLFQAKTGHFHIAISIIKSCIQLSKMVGKGDIVIFQYPYNPHIINKLLINWMHITLKRKRAKTCVILHDINSFRIAEESKKDEELALEAQLLSKIDYVIAHNKKMIEMLEKYGNKSETINLGMFDYLYKGKSATIQPIESEDQDIHVVIAGNLSKTKSEYIYKLPASQKLYFELYGVNYSKEGINSRNVNYHGSFAPDILIEQLSGTFGLVWDGNSINTCSGNYGTYLRYNNPHKFSLYIAAGLPVIVWSESALADIVTTNNLGIVIESINDIEKKAQEITHGAYQRMLMDVDKYKSMVTDGLMLRTAIEKTVKLAEIENE